MNCLTENMMTVNYLSHISAIDGRYHEQTKRLSLYFSEKAYIEYRFNIEIAYLNMFIKNILKGDKVYSHLLTENNYMQIKAYEAETNHDVKAIEYFIRNHIVDDEHKNYIHFGLTSQDVNNPALTTMLYDYIFDVYFPLIENLINVLSDKANNWEPVKMLSYTHGQAAIPTTLGKEFMVFVYRLKQQLDILKIIPHSTKFGGAVGTFSAHMIAYPKINWTSFADEFIQSLRPGLQRQLFTTQIENYDNMCLIMDCFKRINTILIDFSRDMWLYISKNYLKLKVIAKEVGSSAMPHKVNPIDFENAEGNLGLANCIYDFMSSKLPISRLQRDLTDSTVLRNLGVPCGHTVIAISSILKGVSKIEPNIEIIEYDLNNNYCVIAEAVQTILKTIGIVDPYDKLKQISRGAALTPEILEKFIDTLDIPIDMKNKIMNITPKDL